MAPKSICGSASSGKAAKPLCRLLRLLIVIVVLCCAVDAPGQLPKPDYVTYLGGSGADTAYAVATDSAGAIYVAGFTQSPDFPVLNALPSHLAGGAGDLFAAKVKADGNTLMTFKSLDGSPLQISIRTSDDFAGWPSSEAGALRCFADVTFSPTIAGTRAGILSVTELGGGTAENVELSGTAALAPWAKVTPAILNFAQATGSGWSAEQSVTATNDGSSPLSSRASRRAATTRKPMTARRRCRRQQLPGCGALYAAVAGKLHRNVKHRAQFLESAQCRETL